MFGTVERSYVAFQQGEISVYQGNPSCQQSDIACAVLESQALYGTPQENNNSVLSVISHNPRAFLARTINTIQTLPGMIYGIYGKREAYLLFLLAFLGIYELLRQRRFALMGILLAWVAYLGIYFFTFFKDAYLETPYFIMFILAAIGIQSLISSLADRRFFLWSVILVVLTVIGIVRSLDYLYFDTLILLGMIWTGDLNISRSVWHILDGNLSGIFGRRLDSAWILPTASNPDLGADPGRTGRSASPTASAGKLIGRGRSTRHCFRLPHGLLCSGKYGLGIYSIC